MSPERRSRIWALALPIIGGMASQNLLNLVDTAMVGALGPAALAAVGMVSFLHFLAVAALTALSSAVQALASRRFGAGEVHLSALPLNAGLCVSLFIGLPLTLLLLQQAGTILGWVLDDAEAIAQGQPYFEARVLAIAFVGMNFSFRGYFAAVDQSRFYLRTLLVMHSSNILLSYVLIFGHLGLPAMGTFGAGLGTALSIMLGTAIYFATAWKHARGHGFLAARPGRAQFGALLRLGIPSCLQQVLFAGGFVALFWIIGQVGTRELAVANVLINLSLVAILPGMGFGIAAASLVGQSMGAKQPDAAYLWAWDVVRLAARVFAVLGGIMLFLPGPALSLFLHEPELIDMGRLPLQLVGLGMLFEGSGLILMQALLGAGAARTVMLIGIGFQWVLFLPLAWLLGPVLGYGLLAIWLAMSGYRALQTLLIVFIWYRRRWQQIEL
ncbi:MAG: MATE family efflux transporter [Oceanococcaceae bacterium]